MYGVVSVAVTNYWPCYRTNNALLKTFCVGKN
jgi:hypothetical protein